MSDRLKIGQEVLIHGYVDEIRKDTVIIRNEGGYFGTVEYEVTDIEMSDTNDVLDKNDFVKFELCAITNMLADISKSLAVIADKAESEVKE